MDLQDRGIELEELGRDELIRELRSSRARILELEGELERNRPPF